LDIGSGFEQHSQTVIDKLLGDANGLTARGPAREEPVDLQSEEGIMSVAQRVVDSLVAIVNANTAYNQDVMEISAKVSCIMDAAMNMLGRESPSPVMTNGTKLVHPDEFKNPSTFLKIYGDPLCFSNQGPLPKRGRSGNWECPRCRNVNFPRRFRCNKCSTARDDHGDRIVSDYAKQVYERYMSKSSLPPPAHNPRNSVQGIPPQPNHISPNRHPDNNISGNPNQDPMRFREPSAMSQNNRNRPSPPPVPSTYPINWRSDPRNRGPGDRRETLEHDEQYSHPRQFRKASSHSDNSGMNGHADGTVIFSRNVSVHKYLDGKAREHSDRTANSQPRNWNQAMESNRSMDFMPKPKTDPERSSATGDHVKQPQFGREAFSSADTYNAGSDYDRGPNRGKDYSNYVGFCSAFTRMGSDRSDSRDN